MARATVDTETIAGRYQLVARIGSGGMGEVYRARDSVLGRTVAIKILPHEVAAKPDSIDRFRREAQAAARISHPNVVQVHDWGETDSTYFMVMEYIRGRNLREIVATHGRIAPKQAAEIAAQVVAALGAAHSQGLVHRDIKPENVIVGVDGSVKVTDFGIARAIEGGTSTSELFGTVAYIAPEQARGDAIDGRSDLYAAGCLMYELLTGSLPFEGDAARVLFQHLNDRVRPPSVEAPEVGEQIDQIVLKATEPDPADRYVNAAAMRSDLMAAIPALPPAPELSELTYELTTEVQLETQDTIAGQPKRKKRRWLPYALLFLLLAGAGVAAFMFRPIPVPEVVGMNEVSATQRLREEGLEVSVTRRFSRNAAAGDVISTDPGPGERIKQGGTVAMIVSLGPELADVPNLLGMEVEAAKKALVDAGLRVGDVREEHAPETAGTVIAQDKQGKQPKGEPVNITVSSGPEIVEVPDVRGDKFEAASAELRAKGFEVARSDVFNDAEAGTVVSQSPEGGRDAAKGTTVTVTVSKGPAPFAMPNVKGKPCSEAKAQLESLGLVVSLSLSERCAGNKVLDQDPLPGAQVRKGQEVTLYLEK